MSGIGVIVTKLFEKQMIGGIQNAQQQLKNFIKIDGKTVAEREADEVANKTVAALENLKGNSRDDIAQNTIIENMQQQVRLNDEIRKRRDLLNQEEIEYYQLLVKQTEELAKQEAAKINESKNINKEKIDAIRALQDKAIEAEGGEADNATLER